MIPHQFFYLLVVLGLLWIFFMLHLAWPGLCPATPQRPAKPILSRRPRSSEPQAFAGLTHKPQCVACEPAPPAPPVTAPAAPPPRITSSRGRKRQVDTGQHFCPNPDCPYRGGVGWGNLCAHGHPKSGPWRPLLCVVCRRYCLETLGTLFHGKRSSPELIVRVIACLAEGVGIRGTARGCEVDPNTVLSGLVEAAEHLHAFAAYFLHELYIHQVQLDALYAVRSAVRDGDVSAAAALERLSRSPHWVWTALEPESKLLLSVQVGERTLALAQAMLHQLAQRVAPGCVPRFLSDGYAPSLTAIVTHCGHWVRPPRRQPRGAAPKPRWIPLPTLLYAQVVNTMRRRRRGAVKHRVVFGTQRAIAQVLAAHGWHSNTAVGERLNLSRRQRVAAIGRRRATPCKREDGLGQHLALFQVYHNFVLPHASLRQALAEPILTKGTGSTKVWRPCTPAMAAGLTDHVWSLTEVLLYRVPPWPQSQTV